jgi:malate dehydrogenase (oxaloacetate-decarboxylating)
MANKEILRPAKLELAKITNREEITGTLADAIVGADVFIGVSVPKVLLPEMVQTMNRDAIVFAMANPEPEIMPELAKKAGARIVGTGRSDFPNQVNNVLVFPGLFKGALSVRAKCITEEMKVAAARAIADMVDERELHEDNIIPNAFDKKVAVAVADAVAEAYKP